MAGLGLVGPPADAATSTPVPGIRIEMQLALGQATDRPSPAVPADPGFAEIQRLLDLGFVRPFPALELRAVPGEWIERQLGGGYRLAFRLGRPDRDGRIDLTGFELLRQRADRSSTLLRADLRPWLNRPLVLGLTRSESGRRAVLMRVSCQRETAPAP